MDGVVRKSATIGCLSTISNTRFRLYPEFDHCVLFDVEVLRGLLRMVIKVGTSRGILEENDLLPTYLKGSGDYKFMLSKQIFENEKKNRKKKKYHRRVKV